MVNAKCILCFIWIKFALANILTHWWPIMHWVCSVLLFTFYCHIFFNAAYSSGDHIQLLTDNTDHFPRITSLCQPCQLTQTGCLLQCTEQNTTTARVQGQIPLGPLILTMLPWHLISLQQIAYVCTICFIQVALQICWQRLFKVEYTV